MGGNGIKWRLEERGKSFLRQGAWWKDLELRENIAFKKLKKFRDVSKLSVCGLRDG